MPNVWDVLGDSDSEGEGRVVAAPVAKKEVVKPVKKSRDVAPAPEREERRAPRGRGRRGNGVSRGRGGARPAKREFDRRSGTGRGREVKKGGRGAHNWGDATETPAAETPVEEKPAVEGEAAEKPAAEEPVVEEEDKEMSLEEYMKTMETRRTGDAFETRKEREVDESQFSDARALEKAVVEEEVEYEYPSRSRKQRSVAMKKLTVNFATPGQRQSFRERGDRDDRRRGGFQRGRGSPRGRGGRGRSDRPAPAPRAAGPAVLSVADFPALG